MKVYLRTVKSKQFEVEVEPTDTIAVMKQKINQAYGFPIEGQNLVFLGSVLKDDKTVEESKIKESSIIIFFLKPQKSAAKQPAQQPQPKPTETGAPSNTSTEGQTQPPSQTDTTPKSEQPSVTTESKPASAPSTSQSQGGGGGGVEEDKVETLVAMGYPKEEARRALRAAFGEINGAVEFLTNGIPPEMEFLAGGGGEGPVPRPHPAGVPSFGGFPSTGGAGAVGAPGTTPSSSTPSSLLNPNTPLINELRSHPQMSQIRAIMQQNPSAFQDLIQTLAQTQPALAQEVVANPTEFMAALAGVSGEQMSMFMNRNGSGHIGGVGGTGGSGEDEDEGEEEGEEVDPLFGVTPGTGGGVGGGGAPAGIELSEEDKANIDQIIQVTGASRSAAIEAYLACDKMVDRAINFLFD